MRLLIEAVVYANLSGTPYTSPQIQGPYATRGSSNTVATRTDAKEIHKKERRLYVLDKNVDNTQKQEVIAALEGKYKYVPKKVE